MACTRRKRTSIDGRGPQRSRATVDASQAEREVLKLKTEGKTAAEIVNAVGISRASVFRILKEAA